MFSTGTGFQFYVSGEEHPPSILITVVCRGTTPPGHHEQQQPFSINWLKWLFFSS